MNKKILLIGGLNSFGVPYTRDNKENINHLAVVKKYLSKKSDVEMLDLYSMSKFNTTNYLESIIKNKMNLRVIRSNQRESIKICRKKGFFQFIQLPLKTMGFYPDLKSDEEVIVTEKIMTNKTIFLYSCGINDFLENINSDLGKMLNPNHMKESFKDLNKNTAFVIKKIKSNMELLIKLNPSIEIYVLGVYIPTRANYIRKRVCKPIEIFNEKLKELSDCYENVFYVDNSNLSLTEMAKFDWHPNKFGQIKMGENIIKIIKNNSKLFQKKN